MAASVQIDRRNTDRASGLSDFAHKQWQKDAQFHACDLPPEAQLIQELNTLPNSLLYPHDNPKRLSTTADLTLKSGSIANAIAIVSGDLQCEVFSSSIPDAAVNKSMLAAVSSNSAKDVRAELSKLGRSLPKPLYDYFQSFLTWMTGKPYRCQAPLLQSNRVYELVGAWTSLIVGTLISALIVHSTPITWPLLLVSWAITVGGARKSLACIIHRCVHYQFFNDARDRWLAETISTVLMLQPFDGYRHDHVHCHHHVKHFATFEGDPDAKFFLTLGFYPGLNIKRN